MAQMLVTNNVKKSSTDRNDDNVSATVTATTISPSTVSTGLSLYTNYSLKLFAIIIVIGSITNILNLNDAERLSGNNIRKANVIPSIPFSMNDVSMLKNSNSNRSSVATATIVHTTRTNTTAIGAATTTTTSSGSATTTTTTTATAAVTTAAANATTVAANTHNIPAIVSQWIDDTCVWTDDTIKGRCFGLKDLLQSDDPNIKIPVVDETGINSDTNKRKVVTAAECRKACCDIGDVCTTWQHLSLSGYCKLGGIVRVGTEGGDTSSWCEPHPPAKWSGKILDKRTVNENGVNVCNWGNVKPTQCFGLGPERTMKSSTDPSGSQKITSASDCESECCNDKNCILYQYLSGRGCFYNNDVPTSEFYCDPYLGTYSGGRKKKAGA